MSILVATVSALLCCTNRATAARPKAVPNDNRVAAGTMVGNVRRIRLVAQRVDWAPDADDGPTLDTPAFGEEGKAPTVPGPLIRVRVGTVVDMSVHNTLNDSLIVAAACFRGCKWITIGPGQTKSIPVQTKRPGTYTYASVIWRHGGIAQMIAAPASAGAIVVDSAGAPPDRVFVLQEWIQPFDTVKGGEDRLVMTINGKMWPHTERLHASVGDTLRWRVVNASNDEHPMHLHGFYFRVDSRGDGVSDSIYTAAQRRIAVTENMGAFGTMSIVWTPEREGNWIFHCHKAPHMTGWQHAALAGKPVDPFAPPPSDHHMTDAEHVSEMMGGLILGIDVSPSSRRPTATATLAGGSPRRMRVLTQRKPGQFGAHAYVLQSGDTIPAADSVPSASSPLILTRGEPVEITVVNHLDAPTGVHWHGIELESYYDGVGGLSGAGQRLAPRVQPNDSFVVRFTPPRAGTFMYHSHADEIRQIGLGLYAPLIVLERGEKWNPDTDHPLIIGYTVLGTDPFVAVNGRPASYAMRLRAGTAHRLRLMNVLLDEEATISLSGEAGPVAWRIVAKDGADLPQAQRAVRPAKVTLGPGETMDVEVTPKAGRYQLQIQSFSNVLITVVAR